jgi:hypothetical protein
MICNYQNITDYCSNQYSYYFYDVTTNSNGVVTVDDSEYATVVRIDNTTGATKILNRYSNDPISVCDIEDDNENTNEWECYIIYRYIAEKSIDNPPLSTFQDKQKDTINTAYFIALNDGIQVTIDQKTVVLSGSLQDQILYKSILSYAQILYNDDTDATMPTFTDILDNIYHLTYADLVEVFKTYFSKLIYYKNLKDSLIKQCDDATSVDELQQFNWCGTKPLEGSLIQTVVPTTVESKISLSECYPEVEIFEDLSAATVIP